MKILYLLLALCFLSACGTASYRHYGGEAPRETITQSLFDTKERTISEEDIQRILNGKIELQDTVRLAIYKYYGNVSRRYSYNDFLWEDEETLKTDQMMIDTLIAGIRQAARVQHVLLLPYMIIGSKPNIQQLRESAVRLQADMLLVYSLNSDLFQRYRSLKKDEAKAFATCEALLMDVRTGIIPHAGVVTREAYGQKDPSDLSLDEMRRRVQNQAVVKAMGETGQAVAGYLR